MSTTVASEVNSNPHCAMYKLEQTTCACGYRAHLTNSVVMTASIGTIQCSKGLYSVV